MPNTYDLDGMVLIETTSGHPTAAEFFRSEAGNAMLLMEIGDFNCEEHHSCPGKASVLISFVGAIIQRDATRGCRGMKRGPDETKYDKDESLSRSRSYEPSLDASALRSPASGRRLLPASGEGVPPRSRDALTQDGRQAAPNTREDSLSSPCFHF